MEMGSSPPTSSPRAPLGVEQNDRPRGASSCRLWAAAAAIEVRSLGVDSELLQQMMRCVGENGRRRTRHGDAEDEDAREEMGKLMENLSESKESDSFFVTATASFFQSPVTPISVLLVSPFVFLGQLDADHSGVIDYTEFLARSTRDRTVGRVRLKTFLFSSGSSRDQHRCGIESWCLFVFCSILATSMIP